MERLTCPNHLLWQNPLASAVRLWVSSGRRRETQGWGERSASPGHLASAGLPVDPFLWRLPVLWARLLPAGAGRASLGRVLFHPEGWKCRCAWPSSASGNLKRPCVCSSPVSGPLASSPPSFSSPCSFSAAFCLIARFIVPPVSTERGRQEAHKTFGDPIMKES